MPLRTDTTNYGMIPEKFVENGDGTFARIVSTAAAAPTQYLVTGQVTVASTATLIVAARVGRASVMITNLGATDIYCGPAGVTSTTGDLIVAGRGSGKVFDGGAEIWGVASSGSQAVSYAEAY